MSNINFQRVEKTEWEKAIRGDTVSAMYFDGPHDFSDKTFVKLYRKVFRKEPPHTKGK